MVTAFDAMPPQQAILLPVPFHATCAPKKTKKKKTNNRENRF
jgi:hypothetical protein